MSRENGNGATISGDKLCEYTGLGDRQHRNLARAGWFPPPHKGHYDTEKALSGFIRYLRTQMGTAEKNNREKEATIRYKEGKAKTIERQYEILDERYVLKSEIGPALRNVSLHQRAVLQRKLEAELAPNLTGLTTTEIRVRMAEAVDEVCRVFSDGVGVWLKEAPECLICPTSPTQ